MFPFFLNDAPHPYPNFFFNDHLRHLAKCHQQSLIKLPAKMAKLKRAQREQMMDRFTLLAKNPSSCSISFSQSVVDIKLLSSLSVSPPFLLLFPNGQKDV